MVLAAALLAPVKIRIQRVLAALALLAAATAQRVIEEPVYVADDVAPSVVATLEDFLATPIDLLRWSKAAEVMHSITRTDDYAELAYTQALSISGTADSTEVGRSDSAVSSIYAGFADGRYVSYEQSGRDWRYVFRAAGDASAESADWRPWSLATVNEQCTPARGCTPGPRVQAGVVSVRTAHTTSMDRLGQPDSLATWTLGYDPRQRPWYRLAGKTPSASRRPAWAEPYIFSDGSTLGITAIAQIRDGAGVLGVDYKLADVSTLLTTQALEEKPGVWSYLVETNGVLVALSDGAGAGGGGGSTRGGQELISADGSRLRAVDLVQGCVAASAWHLDSLSWAPAESYVFYGECLSTGGVPTGDTFEATASPYRGQGPPGMDWVLVIGQNTTCGDTAIWHFGECVTCGSGTQPTGHRCTPCPENKAGTDGRCKHCPAGKQPDETRSTCAPCADHGFSTPQSECQQCAHPEAEEPNRNQTSCNCRQNYENFARLLQWHQTLAADVEADTCMPCSPEIFPRNNVICPGGPKLGDSGGQAARTWYPKPGWWVANITVPEVFTLTRKKGSSVHQLSDFIYPCPAQSCLGERCRANMTGLLCAQCENPADVKENGICVPVCDGGAQSYWLQRMLKFLVLTLVLRMKTAQLDVEIDGATIAHLTFFGQTLYLLGQFGSNDMFGIRDNSAASETSVQCGFAPSVYQQFVATVFGIPLYMTALLGLILAVEHNRIKPVPIARVREAQQALGQRASSAGSAVKGRLSNKHTRKLFGAQAAVLRGATELAFFTESDRHRDGTHDAPGMWWMLSTLTLKQRLETLTFERTFIEVLMFHYMGITTIVASSLICSEVRSGGETTKLSIVDLSQSCDSTEYQALRFTALVVFCVYSVGFPLILLVRGPFKQKDLGKLCPWRRTDTPSDGNTMLTTGARDDGLDDDTDGAAALQTQAKRRPPKFDRWCRVSNIFRMEHQGWMALLLWRRAVLVVAFVLAQKTGGQIWLGSGYGVDFRVVPFVLLVVYVIVQAHMKPFLLPSDNDLELCCLCGLLLAIYADTSLDQPILRDGKVKLKTVVVGLVVMIVVGLVAGHKRYNAKRGALAKVGLTGPGSSTSSSSGGAETSAAGAGAGGEAAASASSSSSQSGLPGDDMDNELDSGDITTADMEAICEEFHIKLHVVKSYRKAFKVFDADGSGDIDAMELAAVFRLIGDPLPQAEVEQIMAAVDVDNSGSIDFRELVGMLAAREAKRVEEEEIVEAFDALVRLEGHAGRDIDTLSGVKIGRAGVTEALDALSLQELIHDRAATDEVVSRMLAYMNKEAAAAAPGDDHDGMQQSVSFEQFRSVMSQLGSMEAGELSQDLRENRMINPVAGFTVL